MKKILLLSLCLIGLCFALLNFKGLAGQGEFDAIVLDFRESASADQISDQVSAIAQ